MERHSCITCFNVYGCFDSKELLKELNIDCLLCEEKKLKNGVLSLKIGFNKVYDFNVNNMIRVTLKDLLCKVDLLKKLKDKYKLEYCLEIVPSIVKDCDIPKQILSLEEDIIEFLSKTKTIHDVDYYVY